MRPMTGVKGQSMSASLLKTGRVLGRLEYMRKGHESYVWGQTVLTVSMMAYECILGVSVPTLH